MEIKGRVKFIGVMETNASNFSKREIVVTTEEQYPQHILVQFVQDKCDLLDKYSIGEQVEIGINLRGREWVNPQGETKYFNTIQGWKINSLGQPVNQSRKYVHTDTQYTEAQYLQNPAWTHDLLVSNGKGRWETSEPATPPVAPNAPAPSAPAVPAATEEHDDLPF